MLQEANTSSYVDYDFYVNEYKGSKIPENEFAVNEAYAEDILHLITFDRVKKLSEIPLEVKKAICAIAETSYSEDKKTPGVKSESNDGYSVSYSDSGNTIGESGKVKMMYQSARIYLGNTGLLYRGWSRKYDNE